MADKNKKRGGSEDDAAVELPSAVDVPKSYAHIKNWLAGITLGFTLLLGASQIFVTRWEFSSFASGMKESLVSLEGSVSAIKTGETEIAKVTSDAREKLQAEFHKLLFILIQSGKIKEVSADE